MGQTYYYYVSSPTAQPRPFVLKSPHSPPFPLRLTNTCACSLQYEVDASVETFDPAMPTTTMCPSLPGQTVNTLTVPFQQSHRQRSASLSSMRITDYQPTDPAAKFINPRPTVPIPPSDASATKGMRSAPGIFRNAAGARPSTSRPSSPSRIHGWRRLFSHERGRSTERRLQKASSSSPLCDAPRSEAPSRSSSRSMSPESLRRFLSDDSPAARPASGPGERPALVIPEDIAEENEDDDNFATSAISETYPYRTRLSPPPFKRSTSSETAPLTTKNLSSLTLTTEAPSSSRGKMSLSLRTTDETTPETQESNAASVDSTALSSPLSESIPEDEHLTFYDDTHGDDMATPVHRTGPGLPLGPLSPAFNPRCYSLPREDDDAKAITNPERRPTFGIVEPQVADSDASTYQQARSTSRMLPTTIDTGLDDFASELGWMAETISVKHF